MYILFLAYFICGFGIITYGTILSSVVIQFVGTLDILIASLIYDWGLK